MSQRSKGKGSRGAKAHNSGKYKCACCGKRRATTVDGMGNYMNVSPHGGKRRICSTCSTGLANGTIDAREFEKRASS